MAIRLLDRFLSNERLEEGEKRVAQVCFGEVIRFVPKARGEDKRKPGDQRWQEAAGKAVRQSMDALKESTLSQGILAESRYLTPLAADEGAFRHKAFYLFTGTDAYQPLRKVDALLRQWDYAVGILSRKRSWIANLSPLSGFKSKDYPLPPKGMKDEEAAIVREQEAKDQLPQLMESCKQQLATLLGTPKVVEVTV